MQPKVLVVAADADARKTYVDSVVAAGADCRAVSSLREMHALLLKEAFNGVLIDVHESSLAGTEGKRLLNLVEAVYPVAKARIGPRGGIFALVCGRREKGDAVAGFVDRKCRNFPGRKLRGGARGRAHFNVWLASSPSMEDAVRTVTLDACRTGCYVISADPRPEGETVWLRFMEIGNPAPIGARVVRSLPWGSRPMQVPGMGLAFASIGDDQRREIAEKIS